MKVIINFQSCYRKINKYYKNTKFLNPIRYSSNSGTLSLHNFDYYLSVVSIKFLLYVPLYFKARCIKILS